MNTQQSDIAKKKVWEKPQITHFGSVEEITQQKGWGNNDGVGLEPQLHHPSL